MRLVYFSIILVLFCYCDGKQQQENNNEGVKTKEPVAWSLSKEPFYEPERDPDHLLKLEKNLRAAISNFSKDSSELNYIWLGRRLAYLSRYPEAIEVYTDGLEKYPESYKLYRHRGHRYISIREFDTAIIDFEKAAELMPKNNIEIEPDGIPNKINKPLSSTQFNVWYHLGLAYYLKGDYLKARSAYQKCLQVSVNHDLLVATMDWLYMTNLRLGNQKGADLLLATLPDSLVIIENDSYHKRLKMYSGKLSPDRLLIVDTTNSDYSLSLATQGYGVANYYLNKGDTSKARELFDQVLASNNWSAFGFIAAEADRLRLRADEESE